MKTNNRVKSTLKAVDEKIKHVEAYLEHGWTTEREDEEERIDEKIDQIVTKLNQNTYKDYDVEAFKKLISTIEQNGLTNFNMSTFLGHISDTWNNYYDYVHEVTRSSLTNKIDLSKGPFVDKTTNKFNCTSVGCIAGFATAVAFGWEIPKWLSKSDSRDFHREFELIACSYLNIPIWVGKKIFYGDEGSAWAFAKQHSHLLGDAYSHLSIENGDIDEDDDSAWTYVSIDLNSISYKDAVNMLTDIIEGKIIFHQENHNDGGIMINPKLEQAFKVK